VLRHADVGSLLLLLLLLPHNTGRDVYVDIAGWHLFMRDMNAVPGFKMSQALATKLGPDVSAVMLAAVGKGGLGSSPSSSCPSSSAW
jgi:hypothetical protein